MNDRPTRKINRLKNYDYSSKGDYFITICCKERKNILWLNNYKLIQDSVKCYTELLNETGKIVHDCILKINEVYNNTATVEKFVIMPDHVHLLIYISEENAINIKEIIKQLKRSVSITSKIESLWQKGYYDHIIRNESDYNETWDYIDANPRKLTNNTFIK